MGRLVVPEVYTSVAGSSAAVSAKSAIGAPVFIAAIAAASSRMRSPMAEGSTAQPPPTAIAAAPEFSRRKAASAGVSCGDEGRATKPAASAPK